MNEKYFDSINTIEDLNKAEQEGFLLDFKTNRTEMLGANYCKKRLVNAM